MIRFDLIGSWSSFARYDDHHTRTFSSRLAAHALRPTARSARSFRARHRDRRHRARAGAGGTLEWTNKRPAYFLRGATFAAGRDSGAQARTWIGSRAPACRAAARRSRICDRRHDLAVQDGDWRCLQERRAAALGGNPPPLRLAGKTFTRARK